MMIIMMIEGDNNNDDDNLIKHLDKFGYLKLMLRKPDYKIFERYIIIEH